MKLLIATLKDPMPRETAALTEEQHRFRITFRPQQPGNPNTLTFVGASHYHIENGWATFIDGLPPGRQVLSVPIQKVIEIKMMKA